MRPSSPRPTLLSLSSFLVPLTRRVSSVLLNGGPLTVESVVGGALEALRANARSPAAGGGVAESRERLRSARGGAKAEHGVECGVVWAVEWRVVGNVLLLLSSMHVA